MSIESRLGWLALALALAVPAPGSAEPSKTASVQDPLAGFAEGANQGKDSQTKRAIAALMRQNAAKYGEDAAALQGMLLVHTIEGQAVLEANSEIVGFEEADGRRWIAYRVASGVVLNDRELDRDRRLERIWRVVLERTLQRYPSFSVPVHGIAVEIDYNHRPYGSLDEVYANLDETGPVERAKFYLPGSDVAAFVAKKLEAQQLLDRSRVLVDDQPVKLVLVEKPADEDAPAAN